MSLNVISMATRTTRISRFIKISMSLLSLGPSAPTEIWEPLTLSIFIGNNVKNAEPEWWNSYSWLGGIKIRSIGRENYDWKKVEEYVRLFETNLPQKIGDLAVVLYLTGSICCIFAHLIFLNQRRLNCHKAINSREETRSFKRRATHPIMCCTGNHKSIRSATSF